jgi:hypothetical protein
MESEVQNGRPSSQARAPLPSPRRIPGLRGTRGSRRDPRFTIPLTACFSSSNRLRTYSLRKGIALPDDHQDCCILAWALGMTQDAPHMARGICPNTPRRLGFPRLEAHIHSCYVPPLSVWLPQGASKLGTDSGLPGSTSSKRAPVPDSQRSDGPSRSARSLGYPDPNPGDEDSRIPPGVGRHDSVQWTTNRADPATG